MSPPRDYNELSGILQAIVTPLINKITQLETKVDQFVLDRATRGDIDKLRSDLAGNFVAYDAYEARHTALIERDADMTQRLRDLEALIKQQQDAQLSAKDRTWLRLSQLLGVAGIVVATLDWLSQHLHF